ncbi:MAG: TolC family protein [Bacteroidaceae bacterium]|nr:TolC family protein [Bacteroidaceae bacterium]
MKKRLCLMGMFVIFSFSVQAQVKGWSLQECLDYALANNIQLKKNNLQTESAAADVKQSRGQLLPSVSFSTSHQVSYRPFPESGGTTVTNGFVDSNINKANYTGNYGINANWTVWNGNKNRYNIQQAELSEQQAELTAEQTANSIQEQITQLYVQILYNTEGIKVYEQIAEISKNNLSRGKEMMRVGSVAPADVAQLEAQVATDNYNIVSAKGQLARYKMQLKQLLELDGNEEFDIVVPMTPDEQALAVIPSVNDTYLNAVATRPEIKNAKLGIESSTISVKSAKAGYMPTIGISGGVGASTTSASDKGWGKQMKSNLNGSIGVNVSVPIFDQKSTKANILKAKIQQEEMQLELASRQKELWSTIEGYWIDATTNQERFRSATANVKSAETSFELLSEQFNEGLKNVAELTTGKTTLLNAQQNKLESKYTTVLNIQLLKFYNGQQLTL